MLLNPRKMLPNLRMELKLKMTKTENQRMPSPILTEKRRKVKKIKKRMKRMKRMIEIMLKSGKRRMVF